MCLLFWVNITDIGICQSGMSDIDIDVSSSSGYFLSDLILCFFQEKKSVCIVRVLAGYSLKSLSLA